MECCIRWPGLHNHPTSTQLRWFGMNWTAEWRKSSQQVLSICGNYFKNSIPCEAGWENAKRVQSCHQGKGGLLWRISNLKLFWLFSTTYNNFLVTKKVLNKSKCSLYLRFFKGATLCLDNSFVHSWHSLNQLQLECFSKSLEGVPTYAEHLSCFSITLLSN